MPYWEFLIQRENDRAWRPLTSRNLQISEGNYRIIANTSIVNSGVRTQVFHQTEQQPPHLSQNRTQITSNEGMLIVLPFTYLRAGIWHLNCNITVDEEQETHEQLRLKVIPRENSQHNSPAPSLPESEPQHHLASLESDRELQGSEIISSSLSDLNELLADLDLPAPPIPAPVAGGVPYENIVAIDRPLQLDCEIFHAKGMETLMVTGLANLDQILAPAIKLVVAVRNPQDGIMLTKVEQLLPARDRQFAFQVPLELPLAANHFLMGEISLQDSGGESLAANNFTITFDISPDHSTPPHIPPTKVEANSDLADPFAAAFQIAMKQQEVHGSANPAVTAAQLQEIIAASDLEIAKLDTSNMPLYSYDPHSYEVVVDSP